ncbi:28370_t:CDS:2, partial [Racocetra persica]
KCYIDDHEAKIRDMTNVEIQQIILKQIIDFVGGLTNITEIWSVAVGDAMAVKHYIVLLKNYSHVCTCLSIIQQGIICRHYFRIMLATSAAKFHIQKFIKENSTTFQCESLMSINYLCAFQQANRDFLEESLNLSQQKMLYGKLHGMYKKAIQKALQSKVKS